MGNSVSQKILQERIKDFSKRTTPGAMLIHGLWGVGKTHACLTALKATDGNAQIPFCYLSLYGAASLDDIYTRLFFGWTNKITEIAPECLQGEKTKGILEKITRWCGKDGTRVAGAFFANKVAALGSVAAGLLVRKQLIVIDDLERKDSKLSVENALGLVSHLVESQECRVIFITNDEEIQKDKDVFNTHKEKAFDVEFLYKPTIEENADIFAGEFKRYLLPTLDRLEVRNLRVIRRTHAALEIINSHLPHDCPLARESILTSTAALGVLHYGHQGKIDIKHLKGTAELRVAQYTNKGAENLTEAEQLEIKSEFESGPVDSLIIELLVTGGMDWAELQSRTRDYEAHFTAASINQKFSALLAEIFRDYKLSGDEVRERLTDICEKHAADLNSDSLDWAADVLVELGAPDRKNEWFTIWADSRIRNMPDPELRAVMNGIDHAPKGLMPFYEKEAARRKPLVSIQDVLWRKINDKQYEESDLTEIAKLPVEDFLAWMLDAHTTNINVIIKRVFANFSKREGAEKEICQKILEAVETLAKESKLNELRACAYKGALPEK